MNPEQTRAIVNALQEGELSLEGEFVWGSNYTFLLRVEADGQVYKAVYKPTRGERPLWDFPAASLARREAAAFLVSEALGWNLVPPTVFRKKALFGVGSLQYFIDHDPEYHFFNFKPEDIQRLRPVAVFDLLINNADRKGGHILFDPEGRIWLIDHGICFHVEDKLRTVIWDFAGQPIPQELIVGLEAFSRKLDPIGGSSSELEIEIRKYLSRSEVAALKERADRLVAQGIFPEPQPERRMFPWPPV